MVYKPFRIIPGFHNNIDMIFLNFLGSGESIGSGSADSKPGKNQTPNMSSEEEGGCLGTDDTFSGTLPSTDSQKLSSSNSNSISHSRSTDSQNGMPYEPGFKGLPLTKEAMARHNEEMEKEFMQQHRYKIRHNIIYRAKFKIVDIGIQGSSKS